MRVSIDVTVIFVHAAHELRRNNGRGPSPKKMVRETSMFQIF